MSSSSRRRYPFETRRRLLHDLRSIHYSDELTYYLPLLNLLNALGCSIKPRVNALGNLADAGAGHPNVALFKIRLTITESLSP